MLWMSLMVVIFLAWHFAQIERKEEGIVFSELLARVDAGEVGSVNIDVLDKGPAAEFHVKMTDGRRLRAEGFYSDAVLESLREAGVPFAIRTDRTPIWANLLVSWAPFLLLIGFWVFFMAKFKSGGGTNLDMAGKAVAARLDRAEPRVAPASLSGGAAAALAELRELVTARPPAAVLLTGASGSGKGHVLRALAVDVASPSLVADGATFAEIFLGMAAASGISSPRAAIRARRSSPSTASTISAAAAPMTAAASVTSARRRCCSSRRRSTSWPRRRPGPPRSFA